jgi:hypothetical protein
VPQKGVNFAFSFREFPVVFGTMRQDDRVVGGGEVGGRNEDEGVEEVYEVAKGGTGLVQLDEGEGCQAVVDGLLKMTQAAANL